MAASFALIAALVGGPAAAGDTIAKGPPPAWVKAVPDIADTAEASGAADAGLTALLFDQQFHSEGDEESAYVRYRMAVESPQALALVGTITVTWSPDRQDVTVHHVTIIRDGQTIDVLADAAFETLRREANLEQAMLDGRLTAVLQPPGLRVGDIIDVAYTTVGRDPVTGDHLEQAVDLNLPMAADRVHYRASWTGARPVRVRAADDWTPLPVRRQDGESSVEADLTDLQPLIVPDDVPGRFRNGRKISLSDYRDWSQIASVLTPLYDQTRRLEANSPLKAEIERIRASSDDPAVRAVAALRLVQDQIRYVALVMGEGALTPASADDTWRRRFGDCKAKTVLLLALLDGLDIKAVPAAVSVFAGDGMDQSLPMVSAFDHVLVRAELDGRPYWLDGTRTGDRRLEDIAVPPFRWALPLTASGANLERLVVSPLQEPNAETIVDVDASAGLYVPAKVTARSIIKGDMAALIGGQIGLASAGQRDQYVRALWTSQLGDPVITEVGSTYDAELNVLTSTMTGTLKLNWSADGLIPPNGSFFAGLPAERPEGPLKDAPFVVVHPSASRQVATLKLPGNGEGFRLSGGQMDRQEAGHSLRRTARLDGDTVTVVTEIRSLTDEISAADLDRDRATDAARPRNPPIVFSPETYVATAADRAAWMADQPTTEAGWLDRALALSKTGDYAGAVEAADAAVTLAPESSSALANRGVYRFWTGDREAAAADLDKASEIDPSERIAMNGHALMAMADEKYQDAVVELSRALRQVPNDPFALGLRSQAYLAMEQYDPALRDVDAIIAARPNEPALKLSRIAMLNQIGRADDADREMDALAEANPDDRRILINQAAMKLQRGQAQSASDILDRALPLYADRPEQVLVMRGQAAIALGRLDQAERDFMTVRSAHMDDAGTLNNLCWTAAKAGALLDQALKDCDAALALSPASAAVMDSKGRVLLQRGDTSGALAAYDAALATSPELPASLYGRGLARIALGQAEAGAADKTAAVALDPSVTESFSHYRPEEAPPPAP